MLKDMIESKRVDRLIHMRNPNVFPTLSKLTKIVHPRILSRFFWPPLRDEKLIMPDELQDAFTEYANEYAKIKRGRKLAWMDHLGTVEVEVGLADRHLTVEVSPIQASVLYAFQEHGIPSHS
jgi:anaphase-promoting complex subunit 2